MSEWRGGGIGELWEEKGGPQVERSNLRHVKGRWREKWRRGGDEKRCRCGGAESDRTWVTGWDEEANEVTDRCDLLWPAAAFTGGWLVTSQQGGGRGRWLVRRPNLGGMWRCEVQSSEVDVNIMHLQVWLLFIMFPNILSYYTVYIVQFISYFCFFYVVLNEITQNRVNTK